MLGKRYKYDSKPTIKLSKLQIETKRLIDFKVNKGIYKFESVACCICNESSFKVLSEKDRYGLYMPVVICKQCGLIQTNPRMTQESYNEFYNLEYRKLYGGEIISNFFKEQYRTGEKIFSYLSKNNILDDDPSKLFIFEVGCGAGGILQFFKNKGYRVSGVDLAKEYIEFGREKYGLDLYAGTIEDVKFDNSPDIILYSHVLEHILDPNKELANIKQVLPKGGLLYIEVPGVKNLWNSYNRNFLRMIQNAHVYNFTLTTLRNLLEINGFKMILINGFIESVFKKKISNKSEILIMNDYKLVISYLKKLEKIRKSNYIKFYLKYYYDLMISNKKENLNLNRVKQFPNFVKNILRNAFLT